MRLGWPLPTITHGHPKNNAFSLLTGRLPAHLLPDPQVREQWAEWEKALKRDCYIQKSELERKVHQAQLDWPLRGKLIRGFLIICNFILHSPVIQINLGGSPRLGRIVRKAPAKTSLESAKQNQFVYDLSLLEAGELELFPMLVKQLSSSSYAKPLFKLSLT